MSKTYRVNEIFYSPQGEGARAGEMSVFVRFTGCNLKCTVEPGPLSPGGFDCDTEFDSGRDLTAGQIIDEACRLVGDDTTTSPWIVFTGGEPLLQLDVALVRVLRDEGFCIALETNGSKDGGDVLDYIDWVVCSPKVAEHAVRLPWCHELRYVRGYGQALPKPSVKAKTKYISPAFDGNTPNRNVIDWCVGLMKQDPSWRLSVQVHKLLEVR